MSAVLEVRNLSKRFAAFPGVRPRPAVENVSFAIGTGETVGFIGPNGAGKTTSLKMILGLLRPDRGEVWLHGERIPFGRPRRGLGFLPEQPYFYDYLTGAEILDFFGRLYGMTPERVRQRRDGLLDLLGLTEAAGRTLRGYSKGMLQRIGMAQALMAEPPLLILDEPMSGLDPIGRRQMRDIILAEKGRGTTIFFSSHILSDIEEICDRAIFIFRGRLLASEGLPGAGHETDRPGYRLTVRERPEDRARIERLAATRPPGSFVRGTGTAGFAVGDDAGRRELLARLVEAGLDVISVEPIRRSLEDVFLEMVRREEG